MKEEITQWIAKGIVSHSTSQYASPCIVVHQPHHPSTPLRLCTDFRKLKQKTIKHPYPMPRIDDVIDRLASSKYFTTMDIKKGFLNIPIQEGDRHKTAFVTPDGHFEYNRMSFGLCNAPATMQAAMDRYFDQFKWSDELALYMDDICIHTADPNRNIELIDQVLQRLIQIGLKVDMKKCQFVKTELSFLGRIVSSTAVRPDPSRTADIDKYSTFDNAKQMRSFLGLAG